MTTTEAKAVEAALDRWIARTDRALNQDLIDVMADAADEVRSLSARIERLEEALRTIRMTPGMPFPDAGAHSQRAFADAVWRAWCAIQRIAAEALTPKAQP